MAIKKRTRNILLGVLVVIIIGGIYVYTEYVRRNADLADAKVDIVVSSTQLFSEYSKDEKAANAKYFNKVANIRGLLKTIDKANNGTITIGLESGDPLAGIACELDAQHANDATNVHVGDTVTVTGTCTGKKESVMDIPSDVEFNRCSVKLK